MKNSKEELYKLVIALYGMTMGIILSIGVLIIW